MVAPTKQSTDRSPGSQRTPKGFTQGIINVDPNTGNPISTTEDVDGKIRLCVDAEITAQIGDVSVDLDFVDDGVHIGDRNTGNELKIEPDGSINVNSAIDADEDDIAISSHPNQIFTENTDTVSTTASTEIFSYTSTSNNTRIMKIECTCDTSALFTAYIDGTSIRAKRSSPLDRNVSFDFLEHRTLSATEELTIEIVVDKITTNAPFNTFVSLEGYIK